MCAAPHNAELVRSLGAAHIVDYTAEGFTREEDRYDVILDNVGNRPLRRLRSALTPGSSCSTAAARMATWSGPPALWPGQPWSTASSAGAVGSRRPGKTGLNWPPSPRSSKTESSRRSSTGAYPLADTAEGLRHVERGHSRGKVVVTAIACCYCH